jgi:signal transduction histidine kinase
MRTAGVFLIFAAVFLRGWVLFSGSPDLSVITGLMGIYGILLISEMWIVHRRPAWLSRTAQAAYLLIQAVLILFILDVSTYEDFYALLFIPISLEAVSFFGRRYGFIWIAGFAIELISIMLFSDEGPLFGLAMGILYGGICFLFGGFAYQVLKAEAASTRNRRMFDELQAAHHQLQGYADQVANLAVEQERNRLARDLHDSVTQTVFSMNLAAQSARLMLDKEVQRAAGQLQRIEELSSSAQGEIQTLVSQLKPHSLTREGLPSGLQRLAEERATRDGLQVTLELAGEENLGETETRVLHAIVSEALTNVVKHSGEHTAIVRLITAGTTPRLEIEDHGTGFDPTSMQDQRGHLGLKSMSERAREIGWRLSVESAKGQGTRLILWRDGAGGRP